jgi:RNA polymerase sigma-70 factor (ECF subfamily)
MNDEHPGVMAQDLGDEQLQALVDDLNRGDERAIQRAFQAYEPFLRMVVRRRLPSPLRARIDSSDIIQSIWADLLPGFRRGGWRFPDATRLRSFLVRATRNRLIDRQRQHGPDLDRERSIASGDLRILPAPETERASQQAQAGDLWERMLASCPPSHRDVLLLKREGLTSAEIADRVGLHEASVRRILCDLARRLGVAAKAGPSAGRRTLGQDP